MATAALAGCAVFFESNVIEGRGGADDAMTEDLAVEFTVAGGDGRWMPATTVGFFTPCDADCGLGLRLAAFTGTAAGPSTWSFCFHDAVLAAAPPYFGVEDVDDGEAVMTLSSFTLR